jgi:hypothetical protein
MIAIEVDTGNLREPPTVACGAYFSLILFLLIASEAMLWGDAAW